MQSKNQNRSLKQILPFLFVILGTIGFIMAFVILAEKIALLKDANYHPPCNINPIISCGSVMQTWQSSAFGFPNPIIGIAGFAIVVTVGMALLAGAQFQRWFWLGLEAGTIFGVGFIHWLFFQSVYGIGALCPFCMVVWTVTIPIFLYTTLYNLREGYIATPVRLKEVLGIIQKYHASTLFVWYLAIIIAILIRFWSYWSTLL